MSYQYDIYLKNHRENVKKGFEWIRDNLKEVLEDDANYEWYINFNHDKSKEEPDEYDAYDEYFYGINRSYGVVQEFNKSWLKHIHRNPHHWQHWVLINDDPTQGVVALDMPHVYIIEMICDWWSFSWSEGKLDEIFDWYDKHKKYMILSDKTRSTVEDIMGKIKNKLLEEEEGSN